MKQFEGFSSEAPRAGYEMLPKGLYIAGIKAVRLEGKEPDQRLVIRLDIIEGEYTAYYTKRYNEESKNGNGRYEVRYKGDYTLQIPDKNNPNRQHYDWDVKSFNGAIWSVEDSNDGYHWDWNENSLVGKTVGINVRAGTYNGNPYTKIGRLESVKQIRDGRCKVMKDMEPRNDGNQESTSGGFTIVTEEIPF